MSCYHRDEFMKAWGLTYDEGLTGRVEAKRLLELLKSKPQIDILSWHETSNAYGTFYFIRLCQWAPNGHILRTMELYGAGYNDCFDRKQDWFDIGQDQVRLKLTDGSGYHYPRIYVSEATIETKAQWRKVSRPGTYEYPANSAVNTKRRAWAGYDSLCPWDKSSTWRLREEVLHELEEHAHTALTYEETLQMNASSRARAVAVMERAMGSDYDAIATELEDNPELEEMLSA